MSDWLARYSLREKMIVFVALLVMVVLGVHSLVIEPYQLRVAELQSELQQQRTDLDWMKSAVAGLPATAASSSPAEIDGTLASFVDQVVRGQRLSGQLTQMSPVGSDEIRMRYSAVDFNRLISFIAQVNASGLDVKDIRISPGDNPGIVDSNVVLVRRQMNN
ncbi:MAG TPA: type II secretion system protein GspM [Gammaproteobacteria bacterium]|nr:type II secretion system protein GspM [Gammaproteobacteria bacterium]